MLSLLSFKSNVKAILSKTKIGFPWKQHLGVCLFVLYLIISWQCERQLVQEIIPIVCVFLNIKNIMQHQHSYTVNVRDVNLRICVGAFVILGSCCAICDMRVVSCGCVETVQCCKLQGGFLRAGHHVGEIWPLLPAIPPVLELATSVWGCGSLLTLLAGGAWSQLSLSGP